jgi:L-galactose dehydrogenase
METAEDNIRNRHCLALLLQVGRYGQEYFDFSAERMVTSVQESLARLQIPYIDIIQCHDIEFGSLDQVCRCMPLELVAGECTAQCGRSTTPASYSGMMLSS